MQYGARDNQGFEPPTSARCLRANEAKALLPHLKCEMSVKPKCENQVVILVLSVQTMLSVALSLDPERTFGTLH